MFAGFQQSELLLYDFQLRLNIVWFSFLSLAIFYVCRTEYNSIKFFMHLKVLRYILCLNKINSKIPKTVEAIMHFCLKQFLVVNKSDLLLSKLNKESAGIW